LMSELGENEGLDLLCIGEQLVSDCHQLLLDRGGLFSDDLLDLGRFREGESANLEYSDDLTDGCLSSRRQVRDELVELLQCRIRYSSAPICDFITHLLLLLSLLLDDFIDGDPLLDRILLLVQNNILDGLLSLCRYLRDPQMLLLSNGCSKGDSCSSCTEENEGEIHG
ncbi:hypothetical protein PMAYCL1PPCAC_31453, partial [Pristionchus mayeri]